MPTSQRHEPRITVNDLALFMVSSDTARLGIIKRSKFPKIPPIIRYRDVRPTIVAYLADINRPVQALVSAENVFAQRAQDGSGGALRQDDARQSIEVLHAIQGMRNQLVGLRFTTAPRDQPPLQISAVEVSVRLDLFVHGISRGVDQIGGAVLRLTQDDADTDMAKAKRREMGTYVATIARLHTERGFASGTQIAYRLCMSIDVRHGELFPAPSSSTRRITDIENACRFIAAVWPSIT
jgi:hypothetical protein